MTRSAFLGVVLLISGFCEGIAGIGGLDEDDDSGLAPYRLREVDPQSPCCYSIEVTLYESRAGRRPSVVSRPDLMTVEGCECMCKVGQQVPAPNAFDAGGPALVETGWSFEGAIRRTWNEETILFGRFATTWLDEGAEGGRRVRTTSRRFVRKIAFGKTLTLSLPSGGVEGTISRCEIVVRQCRERLYLDPGKGIVARQLPVVPAGTPPPRNPAQLPEGLVPLEPW